MWEMWPGWYRRRWWPRPGAGHHPLGLKGQTLRCCVPPSLTPPQCDSLQASQRWAWDTHTRTHAHPRVYFRLVHCKHIKWKASLRTERAQQRPWGWFPAAPPAASLWTPPAGGIQSWCESFHFLSARTPWYTHCNCRKKEKLSCILYFIHSVFLILTAYREYVGVCFLLPWVFYTHPSSRDVRRGFTSSNTTFWESSGPWTLEEMS